MQPTPYQYGSHSLAQASLRAVGAASTCINPPWFKLSVEKVPDYQDEFQDQKYDLGARVMFDKKSVPQFWLLMCSFYPKVAK